MNIVLGSMFRNSSQRYVQRYMGQAAALQQALRGDGHTLRIQAVEGDSANNTISLLLDEAERFRLTLNLAKRDHGGPVYGSTEQPERMVALSHVANAVFEETTVSDDVVVYIESDLVWLPPAIQHLIDQLEPGIDVIAPMVFAGAAFYDIWGFRVNGSRFSSLPPFYAGLKIDGLTPIDSAGSCLVMRGEVARQTRMTTGALVEFCDNARAAGFNIFCDARERIYHP